MHLKWLPEGCDAAFFMAERKNTNSDFSTVVKQMAWTAHYLENDCKPSRKAKDILNACIKPVGTVHYHYRQLCDAKGRNPLLWHLLQDIDRILMKLKEIKEKQG